MVQTDPDVQFMKRALRLAARGAGMTSPNPLVGAVVVKDGAIVGSGYHQAFGGPHAEVNAIADAGAAAMDGTLYVTLEPCNHHGLTPPCAQAVVDVGIARVVVGMVDPNPDVAGGGAEYLRRAGIEVKGGVLERECRALNQAFIKYVTTGVPYVMLKVAATLDGFIATSAGESKWITSELSRQFAHRLRSNADGVLAGIGTVIADDPLLTVRLRGKKRGRQRTRIVLDSELKIPLDSQLVRTVSTGPVWVVCREDASAHKERTLVNAGVHVIRVPARESGVDLPCLLKELGRRRISSILVEGGGRVLGSFIQNGFADEFYFFYAPKILADSSGVSMLSGRPRLKIADCVRAYGISTRKLGEDLLVCGRFREQLY
jgi:diaminohydroxyphosphoribosylaminopyrimidine deaminase / 5-amino-6-(5-phosphoribosylamino)uracil reductase